MGVTGILIALIGLTIVLVAAFLVQSPRELGAKYWPWPCVFFPLCVSPWACPFTCSVRNKGNSAFRATAWKLTVKSLYVDDAKHIPAQHFQNHRVPPDTACYSCHTDYTIFGPFKDKLAGMKRIYLQYVSTPPTPITIPGGFKNAQCLHCHLGARAFEENPVHASMMDSLTSNQMSCLTSGCHDSAHDVANISHEKVWKPGT